MRWSALHKLRAYSWRQRLLLGEACLWLGVARGLLLTVSFQRIGRLLRLERIEPSDAARGNRCELRRAAAVGWAVDVAARHTPWQSRCLAQGLAATAMLKRRQITGVLVIGVMRDGSSNLIAHAWVRCEDVTLTGKTVQPFTPLAAYTWAATGLGAREDPAP